MADIQHIEVKSFAEYVRQILNKLDSKSTNRYALLSFLTFLSNRQIEKAAKEELTCWIVTLLMKGKSANTVKRYLCKLHVVYRDWVKDSSQQDLGATTPNVTEDPFDGLLLLTVPENQVKAEEASSNLDVLKKFVSADTYRGEIGKLKAVFFYLLYNPDLSIADVINLKFIDVPKYCPQTVEILEAMDSSKGRKYMFPLDQPDKRMSQIARETREGIGNLLKAVGMKFSEGFTRERITAMWICAAVALGVKMDDIRAIVSVIPEEYNILENTVPSQLTEKERQDIICRVANRINDITTRWYVVNMRDKVTPDIVKDNIKEQFPVLFGQMCFFYPTHNVYRESRSKKKVRITVPFIPRLLFIKVKSDMVRLVMNSIRKVAWGYKYLNTPTSPYSVISQRSMTDFQKHIGEFSDDIRMEMVIDKAPLRVSDVVKVYGELIDGSIGEITEIKEKDGAKIFSVKLTHDTSFSWTVKIADELRLQPLNELQKKELFIKDRV